MARPLEFDRCQAIAQAKQEFHRHGYEATSIDNLTAALGISRASLYNTFGDKHSLMLATIDAACDEGKQLRDTACGRKCSAKSILRDFFEQLATLDGQGCYLLTLGAELSTSDPQVQQRVQASLDENRAMFEVILSRDPDLTPKAVQAKSAALLGTMVSVLTLARVHPDPAILKSIIQQGLSVLE
jgi:TetR/AcrR family transcriptional regulator, transcriptional repressor for nem operon